MSTSGKLTLEFEATAKAPAYLGTHMCKFIALYSDKCYSFAQQYSVNSFSFFFDRCEFFDPEVLIQCSKDLAIIIHATYQVLDGGTPLMTYRVSSGVCEYYSNGTDGDLEDSENTNLDDLRE